MKKIVGVIVCLLLIGLAGMLLLHNSAHAPRTIKSVSITPSPTTATVSATTSLTQTSSCSPKDVHTTIDMGAAAGNIYGMITIKNTSAKPCSIVGSNRLQATSSAKNLTFTYQGTPGQDTILLSPGQSVYSKVHYPNGPQCQTGIVTSQITLSYHISPSSTISFVNQNGKTEQAIVTCVSQTEITQVDLWGISTAPL